MKIVEDLRDLEYFNSLITATTTHLKLKLETPQDDLWFAPTWNLAEWESAIRQACVHNNQVYREMLPDAVIVSEFVAFHLIAERADFHRNISNLRDSVRGNETEETINFWMSIIGAACLNPKSAYNVFRQMLAAQKEGEDVTRREQTLAEQLSPALWSYLLTVSGERFVLERGTWEDISDDSFFRAAVVNVGVSLIIAERFQNLRTRPKIDIAVTDLGREGLTCTESYFNAFTARPPF